MVLCAYGLWNRHCERMTVYTNHRMIMMMLLMMFQNRACCMCAYARIHCTISTREKPSTCNFITSTHTCAYGISHRRLQFEIFPLWYSKSSLLHKIIMIMIKPDRSRLISIYRSRNDLRRKWVFHNLLLWPSTCIKCMNPNDILIEHTLCESKKVVCFVESVLFFKIISKICIAFALVLVPINYIVYAMTWIYGVTNMNYCHHKS